MKSITEYAFRYCNDLTEINLDNVEVIKDGSFFRCTKLNAKNLKNVKSIGNEAFFKCEALEKVDLGNNVNSIGKEAFYECTSLKFVGLGNNVNSIGIGKDAFNGCTSLKRVDLIVDLSGKKMKIEFKNEKEKLRILYSGIDLDYYKDEKNSGTEPEYILKNEERKRIKEIVKTIFNFDSKAKEIDFVPINLNAIFNRVFPPGLGKEIMTYDGKRVKGKRKSVRKSRRKSIIQKSKTKFVIKKSKRKL